LLQVMLSFNLLIIITMIFLAYSIPNLSRKIVTLPTVPMRWTVIKMQMLQRQMHGRKRCQTKKFSRNWG
jgi:hypothetical protein